jgi:hypothetical protein
MFKIHTPLQTFKGVETRYSRSFKRLYENGILISETKIPTLSLDNLLNILNELRKEIEPLLTGKVYLNDKPSTWGAYEPFIMYHILYLKFATTFYRGKYKTDEDEETPDPVFVEHLPFLKTASHPKAFYLNGIIGIGNPIKDAVFVNFRQPSEKIIVEYLRSKRKHYDLLRDEYKFTIFHNMLTRIILSDIETKSF